MVESLIVGSSLILGNLFKTFLKGTHVKMELSDSDSISIPKILRIFLKTLVLSMVLNQ